MKQFSPHVPLIVLWPLIAVWYAGWIGALCGEIYFVISIIRFGRSVLP